MLIFHRNVTPFSVGSIGTVLKETAALSDQIETGQAGDGMNDAYADETLTLTHLKCRSLNVKCVSTMPVVLTRDLKTSCSVGT